MKLVLLPAILLFVLLIASETLLADAVIVKDGQPLAAIFVPAGVMDDATANPEPPGVWHSLNAETQRRRLRESIADFAAILARISGTKIEIVSGAPSADEKRIAILIGQLAVERFGKPAKSFPYGQGFRLAVTDDAVGLAGESDLGTSYAVYTLLDQLGCRWYMPSSLGEALPSLKTISLANQDLSTGPYTIYRGLWYCDNDFARRNRLGGMELSAGHAIEQTVPKELREQHPEIRALVGGQPSDWRVKWTHPLVAQAIANACLSAAEKDPDLKSWSLSPDDGMSWDESDDAKYDAGDLDSAAQTVSKTDRLMVLTTRVAEQVTAKHPEIRFGVLAYVDYTRPPIREKVHPAVVPQIAPITFSRAQPMTDDGEPNNESLRYLVEGWGKAAAETSYYFYGFYLAEVASPHPMIGKWSVDIPIIYEKGNCKYWQPETITNFDTSFHAHHLGLRMAWNPQQDPAAIVQELHEKFYGHAGAQMAAYWHFIDDVWVHTPEYAGCGFGHLRRWTPDKLKTARELLDQGLAACQTEAEKSRVQIAAESFTQFELFMKLRRDLADGKFENLAAEAEQYRQRMIALSTQYQAQFAFTKMGWTGDSTLGNNYFDAFYKQSYDDATRVAKQFEILTQPPIRRWRVQQDKDKTGEAAGWHKPEFQDADWRTTDCAVDTWSSLNLHSYMGSLWYRTQIDLPQVPSGKKVFLWLAATDGRAKLFVNGQPVPYVNDQGESAESFSGYCQPASFEITAAMTAGAKNQISLFCTREFINELGTGGLLGPVVIYREK